MGCGWGRGLTIVSFGPDIRPSIPRSLFPLHFPIW